MILAIAGSFATHGLGSARALIFPAQGLEKKLGIRVARQPGVHMAREIWAELVDKSMHLLRGNRAAWLYRMDLVGFGGPVEAGLEKVSLPF